MFSYTQSRIIEIRLQCLLQHKTTPLCDYMTTKESSEQVLARLQDSILSELRYMLIGETVGFERPSIAEIQSRRVNPFAGLFCKSNEPFWEGAAPCLNPSCVKVRPSSKDRGIMILPSSSSNTRQDSTKLTPRP